MTPTEAADNFDRALAEMKRAGEELTANNSSERFAIFHLAATQARRAFDRLIQARVDAARARK